MKRLRIVLAALVLAIGLTTAGTTIKWKATPTIKWSDAPAAQADYPCGSNWTPAYATYAGHPGWYSHYGNAAVDIWVSAPTSTANGWGQYVHVQMTYTRHYLHDIYIRSLNPAWAVSGSAGGRTTWDYTWVIAWHGDGAINWVRACADPT